MDRLPPLRLLTTFEAVARLGSMREAAARLNVTQPAVSQSLRALEVRIGTRLFDRSRRPARLTDVGERLARATRDGLGQIEAAIDDIRAMSGVDDRYVNVACTLGMATYWLMPKLPDFYARHLDITVNVQAPATDLPTLTAGIDAALRYGRGNWPEGRTRKLFEERVCPVGRPALIERLRTEGTGLEAAPLIHVLSPANQHWAGWQDYLARRGIPRARLAGQSFDNYVQAVQAALDGRGLILGWRSITGRLIGEGALEGWPGGEIDMETAYFVTEAQSVSQSARFFVDWLEETARAP